MPGQLARHRGCKFPGEKEYPTTLLREPCAGSRESSGETSVAVYVGRASEHRKGESSECRGFQIGRNISDLNMVRGL